jgi:glycosyltransferase involved in cell wall biosynthesis
MIVRNSAATLPACLQSVRTIADELIVVDTGSTDDTPEIARSFGATVVHAQWTNDFSAARNQYLARARYPWIVSIDADEVLDGWNRNTLQELLSANPNTAFVFQIKSYFPLKNWDEFTSPKDAAQQVLPGVGFTLSSTVRLFPNRSGLRYVFPVHESLLPALNEAGIRIRKCVLPIHHFGYLSAGDGLPAKARFYKALGLKKIAQYPECFLGYWELGKLFLQDREYEDATGMFEISCRMNPRFLRGWRFLASCLLVQNRCQEAGACLDQASRRFPFSSDLRYLRCVLELQSGNYAASCSRFRKFLRKKPNYVPALLCLARAYEQLGQPHLAVEQLHAVTQIAPWLAQPYASLARLGEAVQDPWLLTGTPAASRSVHDLPVQRTDDRRGVSYVSAA